MRKIKHWQGYGTVKAGVVKDGSCTLHIRVEGNHEWGINCGEWDEYRLFEWLVKRFDKTITDYALSEQAMYMLILDQRTGERRKEICII